MKRPVVLLLGPSREALSGVATHLNLLLPSGVLGADFALSHFQIGSEGRRGEGMLGRWLRLAASPFRLAAEIARSGAAIVHLNTSLNAGAYWRDLVYVATAKLCGARVLYQVHGGALPHLFIRRLAAFLRWSLTWPDAVVVLARSELDAYRAFVPGQSVTLVPNGIDCAAYLRHSRPPIDPQAPLRLAYVGRLARGKGLYESLEALALARSRGVAARLLIGGSGPEEARLRNRVRELGLRREVTFLGPLDGERKARQLCLSDAFLLPSYSEGLPYALLEAMAAGAVPVVTAVGAMPDVVAHGEHGLVVPPGDAAAIADAIVLLSSDRAAAARMSAAARKRVAGEFPMERVAADLRALYHNLLDRNNVRNRRLDRRGAQRA